MKVEEIKLAFETNVKFAGVNYIFLKVKEAKQKVNTSTASANEANSRLGNAKNAYSDLIQKGFKAELAEKTKNGMNPVYFQSFVNYNDAKVFLDSVRNSSNNQAWLLID